MIKNERQYRITKLQVERFKTALAEFDHAPIAPNVSPRIAQAEHDALKSQLAELKQQVREYEDLKEGRTKVVQTSSLAELPTAFVKARISAGLTQKDLAQKLGVKEQQIQHYEDTGYINASLQRLSEIATALNMHVSEELFLPSANLSKDQLFAGLKDLGFDGDFVTTRLLPFSIGRVLSDVDDSHVVVRAAQYASKATGIALPAMLSGKMPMVSAAIQTVRHKLAKNADPVKVTAHTMYAHYLALLLLEATEHIKQIVPPDDTDVMHDDIIHRYGSLSFTSTLKYVWEALGIPVLPLRISGGFHGATWRVNGRNVIVLNPSNPFPAGWLNDLLHETGHTTQEPDQSERSIVEVEALDRSVDDSPDEKDARMFAVDVTLRSQGEAITTELKKRVSTVDELKAFVHWASEHFTVPADSLALYVAFRLEGSNWWGAATNMQDRSHDPFVIARTEFMERVDLSVLNPDDRSVLVQAVMEE